MISKNAIIVSILILLCLGPVVNGQNAGDWNALSGLPQELRLIVELKGGNRLKGRFAGLQADSITLRTDRGTIPIRRDEISRVYRGEKRSRVKSALIGAGIGLGVGVVAGVVHERNSPDPDGLAAAAAVLYGIPAGAAIGAAAGGGIKKGDLLYEAR